MQVECVQPRKRSDQQRIQAVVRADARPGAARVLAVLTLLSLLLLAGRASAQEGAEPTEVPTADDAASVRSGEPAPQDDSPETPQPGDASPGLTLFEQPVSLVETASPEAPSEPKARVTGSIQTRATIQGGDGNDRLSSRLGLEWLAGRWSGGFSLELSNDDDGTLWGREGVGSLDLSERWLGWTSRGPRRIDLRLGTARGITFAEGLVLGSPTFDGLELSMDVTKRQRLIIVAGRTESLDPDDLLDDDLGLFPDDDLLGNDGRLAGLRHEIRRGASLLGVNLLHAEAEGADAAMLGSADWAFTRGPVDFSSEVAFDGDGGWGAFARTSVTPAETWGVTVEARRYQDFKSPLDAAPRYEGLSSSDEQDEVGGLVRFDFAPFARFSGSASFDYSQGGETGPGKSNVRRDTRLALRWALGESTTLAYGFELEDLAKGRDGRVHSLLLTHSFEKYGRLSARFSFDRAGEDPRDSLRVSWRCPVRGRKMTVLVDATLRLEEKLTKELQAGFSMRLGTSSFLTCRATITDDDSESVDVTWYRRF